MLDKFFNHVKENVRNLVMFCFLNYESEVGPDGTKSGWIPSDPKSLMKKVRDGFII